jgi:hypothetical protein
MHRPPARVLLVAIGFPLAIFAAGFALMLAWLPALPDPIALHWSPDGPDRFSSPAAFVGFYALLAVAFVALFGTLAFAGRKVGPNWVQKALASTSFGVAVLLFVVFVGTVGVQLGLDDAKNAPDIGWLVLVGLIAAPLAGLIGWFVQPKRVDTATDFLPAEPLHLAPQERAVWLTKTRTPIGALIVIILAVTLVLGCSIFVTVQSGGQSWLLLIAPALLIVLALSTTSWRVRVDESGLEVRSLLGRPVYRVAVADVEKVGAIEVSPGADFGGWGIRLAPGRRTGIITRGGAALDVVRRDGSSLVVTVDDAETGAALLAAYAAIQAGGTSPDAIT